MERHETLCGSDLCPGTNAAQVSRVSQRDDRDSMLATFLDSHRDGLAAGPLSVAESCISDRQRSGIDDDFDRPAGEDFFLAHPLQINRSSNHAVRIVPDEVRFDEVIGNDGCFLGPATGPLEEITDQSFQRGRFERFHRCSFSVSI